MMTNLTFAASRVLFISFSNLSRSGNYTISKKSYQYSEDMPKWQTKVNGLVKAVKKYKTQNPNSV